MGSHKVRTLSTIEGLQEYLAEAVVVLQALFITFIKLVPRFPAGWPFLRVVTVSYIRSLSWLPLDWSRNASPTTGQTFATFCAAHNFKCRLENVPSTSNGPPLTLHFLQLRSGDPEPTILLYFHGGAYVNPLVIQGQLPFAVDCAKSAGRTELVVLEYTLSPELKYPGQMIQAVEAVQQLLKSYRPDQIVLGGDSAGGNLLFALLAHIKRPHPDVKPLEGITSNFAAAFAISPWVELTYKSSSFRAYSSIDYISAKVMTSYTKMWSPKSNEVWADLLVGGAEFWQDISVKRLLITAGGSECFSDGILKTSKQLGAGIAGKEPIVESFVGKNEVHVQCVVDKALGLPHGHTAKKILSWLENSLQAESL